MKKITLFILALGLTFGAIAQVKDASNLTPMKVKVSANQTKDYTLYPNSFNDFVLTTDSATLYFSDQTKLWTAATGTNQWVDNAYAQIYNIGWNVPVKGIAAMLGQATLTTTGTQVKAALHSATSTTVGNEVSFVNFNSNTASDVLNEGLALATFTLPAIQNMSDFAVVITVPEFTLNATQDTIISDFLLIGSTPDGKSSGDKSFSYSYTDETMTSRAWVSIYDAWGGLDVDMMIFPLIDGAGLNNVDVNTLSYVYPNPAKDQVTLASSFNMEKVEIFNMLGQKVYENTLNGNATTVNVSDFNNGTYIVKIFTEAGLATKKIVVE